MKRIRTGRGGRPLRIAYGRIFHEANAFSPLVTERAAFEAVHHLRGGALARAASLTGSELAGYLPAAELTGFVAAARLAGDVATVPLSSSFAVPGGPVSAECFEWLLRSILDPLAEAGPIDGIYLALHGSMQVVGLAGSPEAVILRKVRAALPPGAMLAVSYDLHANVTSEMVELADVLVAYRTNPHWDLAPTGFRAGNRLVRALRGQVRPVHAWRKLPLVLGGGTTIDFLAPMRGVFRFMRGLERDPAVLSASLFMVHPYTAAEDHGWSVHVCTDGDRAKAERLADALADRAWSERKVPLPPMRSIEEALDEVKATHRRAPITLVDVADIVGAGAPGGNTRFVEALAKNDRGLRAYVPVHDPALVAETWPVAIGERVSVTLRGTPGYGMPAVPLEAQVGWKFEGDFGRSVRLDVGSFHVVVTERGPLPIHPKFWREIGLDPRQADLIVQKNFFHYRMFYALISFTSIPVVSEGATSLERVRARQYRVPTFPRDDVRDWREHDLTLRRMSMEPAPVAATSA